MCVSDLWSKAYDFYCFLARIIFMKEGWIVNFASVAGVAIPCFSRSV